MHCFNIPPKWAEYFHGVNWHMVWKRLMNFFIQLALLYTTESGIGDWSQTRTLLLSSGIACRQVMTLIIQGQGHHVNQSLQFLPHSVTLNDQLSCILKWYSGARRKPISYQRKTFVCLALLYHFNYKKKICNSIVVRESSFSINCQVLKPNQPCLYWGLAWRPDMSWKGLIVCGDHCNFSLSKFLLVFPSITKLSSRLGL